MAFVPEFMRRFDEFVRDRQNVHSAEDWAAFSRKWFPLASWPTKSPAQRAEEGGRKIGPVDIGGRLWSYTTWTYDLDPVARYHYFWTLAKVGDPVRFPHLQAGSVNRPTNGRWTVECPHCEISTEMCDLSTCPLCGRELIQQFYEGG